MGICPVIFSYEAQSESGGINRDHPYGILYRDSFPVRIDAFEPIWQSITDTVGAADKQIQSLTEKDFAMAKEYVLNADRSNDYLENFYGIHDIIWEEMQAYYSGDKDLEEALDIIENRAGLYTKERD